MSLFFYHSLARWFVSVQNIPYDFHVIEWVRRGASCWNEERTSSSESINQSRNRWTWTSDTWRRRYEMDIAYRRTDVWSMPHALCVCINTRDIEMFCECSHVHTNRFCQQTKLPISHSQNTNEWMKRIEVHLNVVRPGCIRQHLNVTSNNWFQNSVVSRK